MLKSGGEKGKMIEASSFNPEIAEASVSCSMLAAATYRLLTSSIRGLKRTMIYNKLLSTSFNCA